MKTVGGNWKIDEIKRINGKSKELGFKEIKERG